MGTGTDGGADQGQRGLSSERWRPGQLEFWRGDLLELVRSQAPDVLVVSAHSGDISNIRSGGAPPLQFLWGQLLAEGIMPFNGHLLITYAIGIGPVALVSALGGARPIFVFSMSVLGAWLAPSVIYERFSRRDVLLKLSSASLVVVAVALISLS